MEQIPQADIDAMPTSVEADRDSCTETANAHLKVLFFMAVEIGPNPNFPPIFSNGVELWPLPNPWGEGERNRKRLMEDLNFNGSDDSGYLYATKRNAEEYNRFLEEDKKDKAKEVAELSAKDSAHLWENLNALALSTEKGDVYQTIDLDDEVEELFDQIADTKVG